MTNRLAESTSPYLLQHQDNPVDWQEWGEAAFAEARERGVPVLLSVGYAACHWCHVMAHESFEDESVAEVLNAGFVPVKVDREERPDIDAIYMQATTAMTGHGGWPMTCLLTPDGEPFFAGTYYPRSAFLQLLAAVTEAWRTRREEVVASGSHIASALRSAAERPSAATAGAIGEDALRRAVASLRQSFDEVNGGFGTAPKFPPSMVLELLRRHHARSRSEPALQTLDRTCQAMARGGMYDQLAGGFARYSVDAHWTVPHFEKMLYDNAQLLRVYALHARDTGREEYRRVARQTAEFLLRDLLTEQGAFASSLDADADGVEGLTYAWTPEQLVEVLGVRDGAEAARVFHVSRRGSFEHGTSVLQLLDASPDLEWLDGVRARLLAARSQRPQPGRDDKVVTAWNGLAVAALADAGMALGEPRYLDAAVRCAAFVVRTHLVDGRLRRSSRDGAVGAARGVADDYGDLAEGLLTLHQATADPRWLTTAAALLDVALEHFADGEGGFYDTADDAEALFTRPRSQGDNAEPSGSSALAGALLTYSALTGSPRHREAADSALASAGALAERDPRFAGWALATAEAALSGPVQVAVVGAGAAAEALLATARRHSPPGAVVVAGEPDAPGLPLLEQRPLVGGEPAAYVCRGFVCDRPVTSVTELEAALRTST